MKNLARYILFALLGSCFMFAACSSDDSDDGGDPAFKVAFMPDVHFHDVYANFQDGSFEGIQNPKNGRFATIRTMKAQIASTRLYNENYFAFQAALEDARKKGVKYIAMPGDFSDDGQPVHIRGIAKIMDEYSAKYGMQFFVLPGNHDPESPVDQAKGKPNYLGIDPVTGEIGFQQKIWAPGGDVCPAGLTLPEVISNVICTKEVVHQGYAGITEPMAAHGFMPEPEYIYYETPYSNYTYEDYNFETANEQARWSNREFNICNDVTNNGVTTTYCNDVRDTSYLVEPVEGVWLLAIDSNVYRPTGTTSFNGSGNDGWNYMVTHKPHVMDWIADVVARGEAQGKKVVAFSHFPAIEFFDGQTQAIQDLLGGGKIQTSRAPTEATSQAIADTGLRLHIGGHMHFNDTGFRSFGEDEKLFNVQAPSMAAYVPAYKVVTLLNADEVELETVVLQDVPNFDDLFPLYQAEHDYNVKYNLNVGGKYDEGSGAGSRDWDVKILDTKNYAEFNYIYMSELSRLRLLSDYWREDMRALARSEYDGTFTPTALTGADMLIFSQLQTNVTLGQLENNANKAGLTSDFFQSLSANGATSQGNSAFDADLTAATAKAEAFAVANGMTLDDFRDWSIMDMGADFARLSNAGDLAFRDIPTDRAQEYKVLAQALDATNPTMAKDKGKVDRTDTLGDMFQARFKPLTSIMMAFTQGIPSAHVRLNLATGEATDLSGIQSPFAE